ncbi:MAG TPA: L-rhamnose isomerase [bacterium]|nr:L-rhamnose isomerase [bacterium]HPN44387.1 L-rhamnose isomerase [bacterium]
MTEKQIDLGIQQLELEFGTGYVKKALENIKKFKIEIPSWIFGNFGGGRFGDYMPPAGARTIEEKLDDAAIVHKLMGASDTVAMHMLWDFSRDGMDSDIEIAQHVNKEAKARGLIVGSISPTYFMRGSQRGSLSSPDDKTQKRYIEQTVLSGVIAREIGSDLVTIWIPDGSLYPGQIELRSAQEKTRAALTEIKNRIDKKVNVLIEYKLFEPGTYSTVVSDWGSAFMLAQQLGENFGVLVDLGHHPHGTNVEQIVARLIGSGIRCGFHFNTRYAADDDHSVEPSGEMARIFYELVSGDVLFNSNAKKNWAYMIDQCSARENRIHAIMHSIDSLQISLARASLLDRQVLQQLQNSDEIILANRYFNSALLNADVRPIIAVARQEKNLPVDPFAAFIQSGYQQKIEMERSK